MKRDNDYLRELLFKIENSDDDLYYSIVTLGMSADARKEHYHVQLLCDTDCLLQVSKDAYRLTAQGHDFIEAIRDKGIWEKTKNKVAEISTNVPLEILGKIAMELFKEKLSKHAGIQL